MLNEMLNKLQKKTIICLLFVALAAAVIASSSITGNIMGLVRAEAWEVEKDEIDEEELKEDEMKLFYPDEVRPTSYEKEFGIYAFSGMDFDSVEVEITGPNVNLHEDNNIVYNPSTGYISGIDIRPDRGGEINIVLEAIKDGKTLRRYENSVDVSGYDVELDRDFVKKDTEIDIIAVVEDMNGDPVNNVEVILNDSNGNEVGREGPFGIENGKYKIEDVVVDNPGSIDVEVLEITDHEESGEEIITRAYLEDELEILEEELDIEADRSFITEGLESQIEFSVLYDEEIVEPEYIITYEDGVREVLNLADTEVSEKTASHIISANEELALDVLASESAKIAVVKGDKYGVFEPEIKAPIYELDKSEITNSYETTLNIEAFEPSKKEQEVETEEATAAEEDKEENLEALANEEEYKEVDHTQEGEENEAKDVNDIDEDVDEKEKEITRGDKIKITEIKAQVEEGYIFQPGASEEEQGSFEKEAVIDIDEKGNFKLLVYSERRGSDKISVYAGLDEWVEMAELDIKRPKVEFDPSKIMKDRVEDVEVSLMSSEGESLAGYEIRNTMDSLIEKTDSEGRAEFTVEPREDRVNFKIETDIDRKDEEVEGYESFMTNIKAKDVGSPVIEYLDVVDESTTNIVIRDPSRVAQVFLDGSNQRVPVKEEVEIEVELEPGENTFEIYAHDVNGYSTKEEVTIVYEE